MKQLAKVLCILAALTVLCSCTSKTAKVNFSGVAPTQYENDKQPLSIYACNNTSIPHNIEWGKPNLKKIPYGHQVKDGKEYFISKYYIASPPLPNNFDAGKPRILGVLSEDHFALENIHEEKDIFMDYKLLKPIKLKFFPINFYSNPSDTPYCIEQNIYEIPVNIRCPEFKYTEYGKKLTGHTKGLGKGIALLKRKKDAASTELFIPFDLETEEVLKNCTMEIVNDIILEHQIYFGSPEKHHQKIDLTRAYETHKRTGKPVSLYCKARPENEPAAGCMPLQ